jgi:hypothetical protein
LFRSLPSGVLPAFTGTNKDLLLTFIQGVASVRLTVVMIAWSSGSGRQVAVLDRDLTLLGMRWGRIKDKEYLECCMPSVATVFN